MAKPIKAIVQEFQPVEQGNLRGLFTIQIGPCEFRKCRLIQQPGAAPFCSPPQESYVDKEGARKFVTLVKWPSEWQEVVLAAMLDAQRDHPQGIRRDNGQSAFRNEVRERAGLTGGPAR